MRPIAVLVAVLVAAPAALSAGCSTVIAGRALAPDVVAQDRELIVEYFERVNVAADEGANSQKVFFTETQHPDFKAEVCDLGGHTLVFDPSLSTFRPDRGWSPEDGKVPRGRVYVVAVTITVELDGTVLGTQIGSMHVVVLDRAAYGFSPCPS